MIKLIKTSHILMILGFLDLRKASSIVFTVHQGSRPGRIEATDQTSKSEREKLLCKALLKEVEGHLEAQDLQDGDVQVVVLGEVSISDTLLECLDKL